MVDPKRTVREWLLKVEREDARIRCWYNRVGKRIEQFTVQLELFYFGNWNAVVRYDNAHGFCHRDTLFPDGTQEKTPVFVGNVNDTFTFAIEDLHANSEAYLTRYLAELNP